MRDPQQDQHFDSVRKVKSFVGILFALMAAFSVYQGADLKVVLVLSVMSGVLIDAPSVTHLVSLVIKAIPWSKNGKPS